MVPKVFLTAGVDKSVQSCIILSQWSNMKCSSGNRETAGTMKDLTNLPDASTLSVSAKRNEREAQKEKKRKD
jgi:hypothetical protein